MDTERKQFQVSQIQMLKYGLSESEFLFRALPKYHIKESCDHVCVFSAEAKDAASVAHTQLKEAAKNYDRSSGKLKELLQRAPAEGFMAKAGDIASDVRVREAEVDLGMVVVKEAVASAVVMEGYREAIQESKDKLQK